MNDSLNKIWMIPKNTTSTTTTTAAKISKIFSIFKYRLLLLTSILFIIFILLYLCSKYYKYINNCIYNIKLKLNNLFCKIKNERDDGVRLIDLSKKRFYINKSFINSNENVAYNYVENDSISTNGSFYDQISIPLIMITDTTSLQTDIIDLDTFNDNDNIKTCYKTQLRFEINEKRPYFS
jgi:hypothetical protein